MTPSTPAGQSVPDYVEYTGTFIGTDLRLYAKTSLDTQVVTLSNLSLTDSQNHTLISGLTLSTNGTAANYQALWLADPALSSGFTLTGNATFTWAGTRPTNSNMHFQVTTGAFSALTVEDAVNGFKRTDFSDQQESTALPLLANSAAGYGKAKFNWNSPLHGVDSYSYVLVDAATGLEYVSEVSPSDDYSGTALLGEWVDLNHIKSGDYVLRATAGNEQREVPIAVTKYELRWTQDEKVQSTNGEIKKNDAIDNAVLSVEAGRPIGIQYVLAGGAAIAGKKWDISGNTVKSYEATIAQATATQLVNELVNSDSLQFYWTEGSAAGLQREVAVIATVEGKVVTLVKATFNVKMPTPQVTSVTNSVRIGTHFNPGETWLYFGNDQTDFFANPIQENVTPGITFSAPRPNEFAGTFNWIQIYSENRFLTTNQGFSQARTGTGLDTARLVPFYNAIEDSMTTNDTPGSQLNTSTNELVYLRIDDAATMYLVYTPPQPGSIPVAVAKVDWSWSGTATFDGSNWTLSNALNAVNPAGVAASGVVLWDRNVGQNSWISIP